MRTRGRGDTVARRIDCGGQLVRWLSRLLAMLIVGASAVALTGGPAAAAPRPVAAGSSEGVEQTRYGLLTAADRDFLVKVRLAGLWEGPTGQQAQRRSSNPAVREAGIHLVSGHAELDAKVLAIGEELDVELPNVANADQRAWMKEMTDAKSSQEYDQIFVDRLRAAHGKVYGLVSQIRAGTQNSMIRSFAQRTMEVVLDHITMLERTGLVNWSKIELPPAPPPGTVASVVTQTKYGPLTPAERDFLIKVRLAGLWEGPSGQQAQERSERQAVKDAGRHMMDGHAELDEKVLAIGEELGVELPSEPNADQKRWMAEMADAPSAAAYDQVFVARLRAAHGKVYGLVSKIRAGTHNTLVREFAQRTMEIVLDHIIMLERTGLVDFSTLPPPPEPVAAAGKAGGLPNGNAVLVVVMIGIAGLMTFYARSQIHRRRI